MEEERIESNSETEEVVENEEPKPRSLVNITFWEKSASNASIPEEMESQEAILSSSEPEVDQKEEPEAPTSLEDITFWEKAASAASIPERLEVESHKARTNRLHTNLAARAALPKKSDYSLQNTQNEPPAPPAAKPEVIQIEYTGGKGAKRTAATKEGAPSSKRRRSNKEEAKNEQSGPYCSDPECVDCTAAKRRITRGKRVKLSKKRRSSR